MDTICVTLRPLYFLTSVPPPTSLSCSLIAKPVDATTTTSSAHYFPTRHLIPNAAWLNVGADVGAEIVAEVHHGAAVNLAAQRAIVR